MAFLERKVEEMECLNEKEKNFNVLCDEWLSYKRMRIKESTYSNYKFKIVKYLKKDFGEYTLNEFNNIDINRYIEDLQKTLSNKTIKDITTVLKSILKYCERKYDMDFKLDLISLQYLVELKWKYLMKKKGGR